MSENRLSIDIDHTLVDEGQVTARLTGELDPVTAPQLQREMHAAMFTAAPKELVLDFAGITFMDSSGIRVLIDLHHTLRDRDAKLVLLSVPDTPRRVLEISGLTDEFEIR